MVPGYQSATGKTLEQRISFSFTTQSEQEIRCNRCSPVGNGKAINTLPGEAPLLRAYLDMEHMVEGQEVDVTVYALDSCRILRHPCGIRQRQCRLSRTTSSSTVDITP